MRDLPASIRDYYDNVAEPVDASEILAPTDRRRSFPIWVVAVGAAVVVFILIGGVVWLVGGSGSDVIDEPMPVSTSVAVTPTTTDPLAAEETTPTTVPATSPTTIAASPPVVVPDAWNPILVTTKAEAAPAAATCPPGSDPNSPGMVEQARPNPGSAGNQGAAFDRHTGRIVYVNDWDETWTFDVCTNTWQQMNPTGIPQRDRSGVVVYDVDSDRVVSLRAAGGSVYDPNTNIWTRISDREAMPGDHPTGSWMLNGAVYDPLSGLVLAQYDQLGIDLTVLSAYDVDTDRWTRVGTLDDRTWRNLIGYSTQTDQLVFAGLGGGGSIGDDTGDRYYVDGPPLVVDPRTGTATATERGASISGGYGSIEYAADTETAYVQTRPNEEICWFDPGTLTWDNCFEGSDYPTDVIGRDFSAMVGDPINNRLVLINPERGQNPAGSAVWAVDLDTGEWTQLLAPPTP